MPSIFYLGLRMQNKDFYKRMADKFGYKDPQSIYKILLGCTNRFFGEDIVQTTN